MKYFLATALLAITLTGILPEQVLAQAPTDYTQLAPLPGVTDSAGKTNAKAYLEGIFTLIIALAGVLAVVMIIFGGIKYMSTDAFEGKSEAKSTIQNALVGLLLAIGAWLILFTINPKLVEFDLSIQPQQIPAPVAGGGGGGVRGGCQGNCPFSYVNANGVTVNYRACASCSSATSFGLNIKIPVVNGTSAQINTALGNKLKAVQNTSGNPAFQVTETWPPTVNHQNQKQYDGTSVDVSLATKNAANINAFIANAKAAGITYVKYEVKTAAEAQTYQNAGVSPGDIIVVPYITGEHFSVY